VELREVLSQARGWSERHARWAGAAAVFAIAASALLVRVLPPWDRVFRDGRVVFAEADPWIHMRQVDNLLAHFPLPSFYDPYRLFPGGQPVEAPLLDLLVATVAWVLGLGAPTPRQVDVVGAWAPPVLAGLCVPVLYTLGRLLFGRLVALLAAALLAALPGPFLQRSLLSYTDHHVLEVLLALCVLALLAKALASESATALPASRDDPAKEPIAAPSRWSRGWRYLGARRHSLLAGVALAAYLLAWTRGALLVMVLLAWGGAQLLVDLWHERTPGAAWEALGRCCGVALLLVLPWVPAVPGMAIGVPLLAAAALVGWALPRVERRLLERSRPRRLTAALSSAAALSAATLAVLLLSPLRGPVLSLASRFAPGPGSSTVGEARPWLVAHGAPSLRVVWEDLTTSALLGGLGLLLLAWQSLRSTEASGTHAGRLLLVTWSAAMLAATLVQVRFGYYLTAAVALLASWFVVRFFAAGLQRAFAVVVVLAVALYPNLPRLLPVASRPAPGPTAAWLEALDWLRASTPEPFGDAAAYLARHRRPAAGQAFDYPPSAYGVMTWWDHGYWIARIARRMPVANPTQAGAAEAGAFFTAVDEAEGARRMERLGARYVIVDRSVSVVPQSDGTRLVGALHAMLSWAGRDRDDYMPVLAVREADGRVRPRVFYAPAYYRSLGVRLFAFGGEAVEPRPPFWVAELAPPVAGGGPTPLVVAWSRFDALSAAEAHVDGDPARRRLLGWHPFAPCVRLPALARFRRVFRSSSTLAEGAAGNVPEVSVFAFAGAAASPPDNSLPGPRRTALESAAAGPASSSTPGSREGEPTSQGGR
jgi:dolichyl-diphosphooligosaccharide--protein glycosyltransferase